MLQTKTMDIKTAWTIASVAVPLLVGVGFSVLSMTPPDFDIARWCFLIAAVLLAIMSTVWATKTAAPFHVRGGVCVVLGLLIAVCLPEGLRWISRREYSSNSRLPVSQITPKTNAPKSVTAVPGNTPAPEITASSTETVAEGHPTAEKSKPARPASAVVARNDKIG